MNLPKRKHPRLVQYDYSKNGYYFVTICTVDKQEILSTIVGQGLAPAEVRLSVYGIIAEQQLLALEKRFPEVKVDSYVIMPNHIHAIFVFQQKTAGASPCPTLSDVVCAYKSLTTRFCKMAQPIEKIFQSSFHDHIIRNKNDYLEIRKYIAENPTKW